MGAPQAPGPSVHVAVLDRDLGAQLLQAFQVLVNRAGPDGAAPGERHARPAAAGHQRAQRHHRGAHRLDHLIGRFRSGQLARVQPELAVGFACLRVPRAGRVGFDPHMAEELLHGEEVAHPGEVRQVDGLGGQQGSGHGGQGGVLGPADLDAAPQRYAAFNQETVHRSVPYTEILSI